MSEMYMIFMEILNNKKSNASNNMSLKAFCGNFGGPSYPRG